MVWPISGGIEAHHQDRVGPHHRGVLHHPVNCVAARLLQHLGVFADLAADDAAQAGHDVAAEAAAAHGDAEALAERLAHVVAGDRFGGGDKHGEPPLRWAVRTV